MNIFLRNFLDKRIINCSAPGPIHESVRETLTAYAKHNGYSEAPIFDLPDCKPDVFLASSDYDSIFVGDAKDSKNETAGNTQTLERIKKYISTVKKSLKKKEYEYIQFAIGTDDEDAIDEWTETLQDLFEEYGFVNKDSQTVSFDVKHFRGAWITTGIFELKED